MTRLRALLSAAALLALALATSCKAACDSPARSSEAQLARGTTRSSTGAVDYVELLGGGARTEEALPVVVMIHGLGDRPERLAQLFDGFEVRLRVILPRAPDPWGQGGSWFPVEPRLGAAGIRAEDLQRAAARIAATIAKVEREKPVRGKPLVTGFSQGGMLSFVLAIEHPEVVARAIPIAGWIPDSLVPTAERASQVAPLLALHGEDDRLVPFSATSALVKTLAARGVDVRLESEPGIAHAIGPREREILFSELRKFAGQ